MTVRKFFLILIGSLLCFGCTQKPTPDDLIEHPLTLKNELEKCQAMVNQTNEEILYCDHIKTIAQNMLTVINEQQMNPEKFGESVLSLQIALTQLRREIATLENQLQNQKNSKSAPSVLQQTQQRLIEAKKNFENKNAELKIKLGVLSMSTPE